MSLSEGQHPLTDPFPKSQNDSLKLKGQKPEGNCKNSFAGTVPSQHKIPDELLELVDEVLEVELPPEEDELDELLELDE